MAESTIQKKMSSLSSLSIRHKSSALLNNNNNSSSSSSNSHVHSHQQHPSIGSTSQLLPSNGSTYARSINEEDITSMPHEPGIQPSTSTSSINTNPNNNTPSATPPPNHPNPQPSSSSATNTNTNNPTIAPTTTTTTTTTPTTTVESLLTLAHKRITTLVYLKKVHEGKVHWFNTILLSRPELERWFEHHRMVTRTTKFAILGMSLSSLLDINNLQDFLKAMINLLHEFEGMSNDNFKPKISSLSRGIFKQSSKSARKSAGGGTDYSITLQDSGDPSFIYTPNIPFDLDYFEVWITLSDMLVEVYQKMIKFIDTSSGPSGTTPTPGGAATNVAGGGGSNLSAGTTAPSTTNAAAAQPLSTSLPSSTLPSGSIVLPLPPTRSSSNYSIVSVHPTYLTSSHIELISRIDSKLKKLIVVLTKEIDAMARAAIRDELAHLDPMLLSVNTHPPGAHPATSSSLSPSSSASPPRNPPPATAPHNPPPTPSSLSSLHPNLSLPPHQSSASSSSFGFNDASNQSLEWD